MAKFELMPVDGIDHNKLRDGLMNALGRTTLLGLSTLNPDGSPHANTAYFGFGEGLEIVILTPPSTIHGVNLKRDNRAAFTFFDSHQEFGSDLIGLQAFGQMKEENGEQGSNAFSIYSDRFPGLKDWTKSYDDVLTKLESRFFVAKLDRIKLFDESRFGKENYITTTVKYSD